MTVASRKMTLAEYLNYAARGILEYWIVDPMQQKVTVLGWVEGLYEEMVYQGDNPISSPLFGTLDLTAAQILQGQ